MGINQKKATQRQITNFYLNTLLLLLLPRPPPAPPVSHSYKSLHENFTRTEPTLWTEARMRGGCPLKSKWESARLLVSGCIVFFFKTFCLGSDDTGAVGRTMSDHDILEMESDMEDLGDIELGMIDEEVGERTWSFATVVCMLFRSADSVWVLSSWCCGSLSRQLSIFLGHVISGNSSFASL